MLIFNFVSLFADYAYNINGHISKVYIPGNGEVCYEYDLVGRLTEAHYPDKKSFFYLSFGMEIIYHYDRGGRLTQIIYPDGETVEYKYDAYGYLIQMRDGAGITHYEYDDVTHLILKETLPNGISTSYTYDTSFNVLEVLHQNHGSLIAHYRYSYDEGENCISVEKQTPSSSETITYEYDLLDRLVLVKYSNGEFERYTYDAFRSLFFYRNREPVHKRNSFGKDLLCL